MLSSMRRIRNERKLWLSIQQVGSLTIPTLKHWEEEASKAHRVTLYLQCVHAFTNLRQDSHPSLPCPSHSHPPPPRFSKAALLQNRRILHLLTPTSAARFTAQKSTGHCWLFALTIIRHHIASTLKLLKLLEFQLSQSHVFFYAKLENNIELIQEGKGMDNRIFNILRKYCQRWRSMGYSCQPLGQLWCNTWILIS